MKVLLLFVCAVVGSVAGGAVAWPAASVVAAPVVRTLLPAHTKTVAYSSSQYINSLPPLSYSLGVQPHFGYQYPQVSAFAPMQPHYYPFTGASYFPSASIFYPSVAPVAPLPIGSIPSFPVGIPAGIPAGIPGGTPTEIPGGQAPSAPENPAGDHDTAVVDSADQQADNPGPSQPSPPQAPPSNTFPSFPEFPQITNPSFPQIPQDSLPSFPQLPQYPSNPLFPQNPQPSPPSSFPSPSPPTSFPGANNDDRGLNDEDTISVESA